MTQFESQVEAVLSTTKELEHSALYDSMSTTDLFGRKLLWLEQAENPLRSERSKEDLGKILARLNFELSMPERQEEVAEIESLTNDLQSLPETLDNPAYEV